MHYTNIEDYSRYGAIFLRPLFKDDKVWYLVEVYDDEYEELLITETEAIKLNKKVMESVDFLFRFEKTILTNGEYVKLEKKWIPMFYRIAQDSEETLEAYFSDFSKFLTKEISKTIPCKVMFDFSNSSIVFELPFAKVSPAIHINTMLYNWNNVDEFIIEITQSLHKFIPSKNKEFFK